nr:MAG TPA: hypothetical protein [Caudoviricetes sp.]
MVALLVAVYRFLMRFRDCLLSTGRFEKTK